jgi:hypothetical protein
MTATRAALFPCALLCVSTTSFAQVELPKEGGIAATSVVRGTWKQVAVEKEFSLTIVESRSGLVPDKPDGFGDRVTGRCVSSHRFVKGKLDAETGACEYTDFTGDKFFTSWTLTPEEAGAGKVTTRHNLIGGTGKYAGITGGWDVVRRSYRPPVDGEAASSNRLTGTYKLP